jgi:Integrase zinc binding domain
VQLVVPSGLRRRVLRSCHDSRWCGHVGPDKTLARTRINYWWAGQAADCLQYCQLHTVSAAQETLVEAAGEATLASEQTVPASGDGPIGHPDRKQ